jgi:hypothetical protein
MPPLPLFLNVPRPLLADEVRPNVLPAGGAIMSDGYEIGAGPAWDGREV